MGNVVKKFTINYWYKLKVVIPLIISLVLQRAYHIIDNRFVNVLGSDALLIHNVQYNFIVFGFFLGTATATSALIFWRREECAGKQGSVFLQHILMTVLTAVFFFLLFLPLLPHVVTHFGIVSEHKNFAYTYIAFGLLNMLLQSVYGGLDGMLIASGQQKKSMLYSIAMVCGNILADGAAVYLFYSRDNTGGDGIYLPLYVIIGSTSLMSCLTIGLATKSILRQIDGWKKYPLKDILKVWKSESAIAILRALSPLIYTYQLGLLRGSAGFIITYNLILHLAYVFCLPLAAGIQIALRDAAQNEGSKSEHFLPSWLSNLLSTAFIPTALLLCLGMLFPSQFMKFFYDFTTPVDHIAFIGIFLFGCLIGQTAHIVAIAIRVKKKSTLVTRNILIAEYGVLLGGTQILLMTGLASPASACWITVAFCITFLILNIATLKIELNPKKDFSLQWNPAT